MKDYKIGEIVTVSEAGHDCSAGGEFNVGDKVCVTNKDPVTGDIIVVLINYYIDNPLWYWKEIITGNYKSGEII